MTHILFSLLFTIIGFSCLGQTTTSYSEINQDTSINIKNITTNEKLINGKIDDKYDITIYLKFHSLFFGVKSGPYSVKGHYYYDKIKKAIPLVGIYDGGLTLYQFKSKEKQDTILNSSSEASWYETDKFKNLTSFEEKFIIEYQTTLGTWIKNNKAHKLILNTLDLNIYKETEYLHVNSNGTLEVINLTNLLKNERQFELINFLRDTLQTKILLKYKYPTKSCTMCMCGAGSEIGYIILIFDKQYKLIKTEALAIESCADNIFSEETKTDNLYEKKFKITSLKNGEESSKTALLNAKQINFIAK